MPLEWDKYSYRVAGDFLPALINADDSGLEPDESEQLRAFEQSAYANARAAGFTVWHWSTDADDCADDFGRCDVTGMLAMRAELTLCVAKDAAP